MKKMIFLLTLIMTMIIGSSSFAMTHYEELDFVTGIVTASALNVRSGPGTNYKSVGLVYKNEYVRVFAKIGSWYVVQTNSDLIGAVSTKYVRAINSTSNTGNNTGSSTGSSTGTTQNNNTTNKTDVSSTPSELEKQLLDLINEKRTAYGLSKLSFDTATQKTARAKAEDLVANNYFSHNSPTYGTPFEMMKSFGVTYKTAGENIAGNSSLEGAVNAWMNSQGHRENILNNAYNLTGIGVVKSDKYGYVMVQMFVGR